MAKRKSAAIELKTDKNFPLLEYRDPCLFNNYRPILLLSVFSNVQ